MNIERLVYECSKVGIEQDHSGGQIYSYTRGMKTLFSDTELNLSRLADYKEPVDFEPDPEKNIAPMSFTFQQMDTLFPRQFRFKTYHYKGKRLFAFSNNKVSVDWNKFADYDAYLDARKDEHAVVGGRSGAHEYYILAGDLADVTEFPCTYYQSESLKMPYTEQDLCSNTKPDYMPVLHTLYCGDTITQESVRQFLTKERERVHMLKKMAYCLLRYKKTSDTDYARNIVICDEHEVIIYWIAALSFLFSKELAKELTFSTYEYSPEGKDYRICGAFQKGTDYDPGSSYRGCYVFDFCNQRFEDTRNMQETAFYGFLVNSFLYAPEALGQFYQFVSGFDFHEVSAELENAYVLYRFLYLDKAGKHMDAQEFAMAVDFAGYCKDDAQIRRMLVSLINEYMVMSRQEAQECETPVIQLLKKFSGYLDYLERLCAARLVDMLMPASNVSLETVQEVYKQYDALFGRAGGQLFSVYYDTFSKNSDSILAGNTNLECNVYIAQLIYRHMEERKVPISCISPSYMEGKLLHSIVKNMLTQDRAAQQLQTCIRGLTDFYMEDVYAYFYLLMELEGMAHECAGDAARRWIDISEACIDAYMDRKSGGKVSAVYKALVDLECEDRVLRDIVKRSRTNERFALLFQDVCELLENYGRRFQKHRTRIYALLLEAAEYKNNAMENLVQLWEVQADIGDEELVLKIADKIVEHMELKADSVEDGLLESLSDVYRQNHRKADSKLTTLKILKEMETDLAKGKKHIIAKYNKGEGVFRDRQITFPAVTEDARFRFIDSYCSKIMELYSICGNIWIIDYYNNLFDISSTEQAALMELEFRTAAGAYRRMDAELFGSLIGYAVLWNLQPKVSDMAAIILESKMNADKLNKFLNEHGKELINDLYIKLGIEGTAGQDKKLLLGYWNDVFEQVDKNDTSLVRKVMKTFLKR